MKRPRKSRFSFSLFLVIGWGLASLALAQSALEQARSYQQSGQTAKLREAAADAARQNPRDPAALLAAAELLDISGAPNRAEAYRRVLDAAPAQSREAQAARRRLVLLRLQAGEYDQARRDLETYRNAGGQDLAGGTEAPPASRAATAYIEIPGPLLAFQRMAALRPATTAEELLPALARNVVTFGYEYSHRFLKIMPSEYLKLLQGYLAQARELQALAGSEGVLRVKGCSDAGPLLKILGYKLRGTGCAAGPQTALEVDDDKRAFLTADSGFPLVHLEETIQGKAPFEYSVRPVRVPVLFAPNAWTKSGANWVEAFLEDRLLTRLYLAMSRLEGPTAELLYRSPGIDKLKPVSPVLDFFGTMLKVENGRVVVPGGPGAADAWRQLVGASPDNPSAFIFDLLEKDDGWLAAYFDALFRADRGQQRYFTDSARLVRFYRALRGRVTTPSPARPIFRSNAQLMLLVTRLRIQTDGRPYLAGGLSTWQSVFRLRPQKVPAAKKAREVPRLETHDEVVEALFARVRDADENGPLNVFLAVNEMDRLRQKPLEANTILLLTTQYPRFSQHYPLFAEWPQITSASIEQFLDVLESLTRVREPMARADGLGSLQASVALWEILARQGEIPESLLEPTFTRLVAAFSDAETHEQVFDATRKGVQTLLTFAPPGPGSMQEKLIGLLAAPPGLSEEAQPARDEVAARIRGAFDAQRLIPIDTLLSLAEQLERASSSRTRPSQDFVRLASRIKELNLPNPFASAAEKNAAFFGYWTERHIDAERDTDLGQVAQRENVEKLGRARGLLAPHLRDTLVGLVYAFYAPPGSMVLHNNPLFVRSHDFLGSSGQGTGNEIWGPGRVYGLGWPWSGGGRFVGSLSGVAYALADAEKDFLVPQQTQSLIWGELAPQVLLSSLVPRWWRVSPVTQHWAAMHLRLGQDLVAEAAVSPEARRAVLGALPLIEPRRQEHIELELGQGRAGHALRLLTPAELLRLSRNLLAGGASGAAAGLVRRVSPAAAALEQMAQRFPQETSEAAVSAAFGVPHPKVARSFRIELLHLPLFPAMLGYSSRLLAESWESNNLHWAQVADELGLPPAELNRIVPQLTRRMLERVFANDLEDWPAVLTALRATGEEFQKRTQEAGSPATSDSGPGK